MKGNRLAAMALSAALLLCAPSGCSGGGPDSSREVSASVEIHVVTSYGGDDGNRRNYENAVRGYEQATGNRVLDSSATSNEDWKAKVLTDFETGSEPDVLFFFTNADADPFIKAGKVVDLDAIRAEYPGYADNMVEELTAVAADGKRYAVPAPGYWETMFVNRAVLARCGVDLPGPDYTWDQFLSDCQRIKDCGLTPIACSLFEVPHYWFEFCVMNNGSLDTQLDVPASADDEAGRKWTAALEDMKYLYQRGFFPDNTLTATDAETVRLFGDGKAAFLVDGSWMVSYFTQNYQDSLDDYVVAYVPGQGERQASEVIGGISMGWFITRKAWDDPAKRDAAVKFVEHMTSDEVVSTFVTTEVTALHSSLSPSGFNQLQQSAAAAFEDVTGVVEAVQDTISSECKASLFANVQNVVTGAMSAEDAVRIAIALN